MSFLASIALRDISKSYGPNLVLSHVNFTLGPHTRMGVIGRNGSGKSTLLRVVSGTEQPDSGSITRNPPTTRIGYLQQEADPTSNETVEAFILRRTGTGSAIAELEAASIAIADAEADSAERFDLALSHFNTSGAADFESRVGEVMGELGISPQLFKLPMKVLSGGQVARVALASIVLSRYDLLLLDEPTNDLDFDGIERLERFCIESEQGILIVSHDRAFLERTTTAVLEIDHHSHTASEYQGGWTAYVKERTAAQRHAEEDHKQYTTARDELKARARRQQQWAEQGVAKRSRTPRDNDKAQRDFMNDRTEKQASKVRITENAMQRLEVVEKPWEDWQLQMKLPASARSGDVVVRLDSAVVTRGDFTLGPVNLEINFAERVAIKGLNGSGKTTLLSAILGRTPLSAGQRTFGSSVVIGELDQVRHSFHQESKLIDIFIGESDLIVQEARSLLAKFDLTSEQVNRAASRLSPGEQTRAMLALLMARQTNCLVLDEPTNHLDIEAIEQLEQALSEYTGTVLLITHDRRMLETISLTRTITVHEGIVEAS